MGVAAEISETTQLRQRASARFQELGYPTTHDEDWKYTNVAPIARTKFQLSEFQSSQLIREALRPFLLEAVTPHTAVIVNGRFSKELSTLGSLPSGFTVRSLAEVLSDGGGEGKLARENLGRYADFTENSFVALNTSNLLDGVFLRIHQGVSETRPIHFLFVTNTEKANTVSYPRNLIIAEKNSQASVIESYVGLSELPAFTNAVTEIVVLDGSVFDHHKLELENDETFHVGNMRAELKRDSTFATHTFSFGGKLVRNEISPVLNGEGITCTLNGLTVIGGEQHVDNHTVLDHAKPHCQSHELFKGIYNDKSAGVFNGTIIVRPDAQKTNAIQSNKSLLLSADATIDSKPQLKIYADDVKCTHGATVGQLDEDALFYLRSRGLDFTTAHNILIHAFASEVVSPIKSAPLRDHIEELLTARLEAR